MSGTEILLGLLGGIALLLWGLHTVRSGMTLALGNIMQRLVGKTLANRFFGFGAGLGLTLLLQSSTATALLLSSFVTRGAVSQGSGGIAALLGADLGTALVANVLTLHVPSLVPVFLVVGVVCSRLSKGERLREFGHAIVGLGLMLLALQLILSASVPMRETATMQVVFAALDDDLPLVLVLGIGMSWLAHSSLAIVLLIATLSDGLISLPTALVLVLGANIGTTIPPLIATWNASPTARRFPLANIAIRVAGVLLALPFLGLAADVLTRWQDDSIVQVVNFHLLFNLALAMVFMPLVGVIARWLTRLVPETVETHPDLETPQYLDYSALESPTAALAYAVRDATRMGEITERMLSDLEAAMRESNTDKARAARELDDVIDVFHSELMGYLTQVNSKQLSESNATRCMEILTLTINLEHIGDLLDANIGNRIERMIKQDIRLPQDDMQQLLDMFGCTRECMKLAFAVFLTDDVQLVRKLLALKISLAKRVRKLTMGHIGKIQARDGSEESAAFIDLLANLKQVISYASSVAYPIADRAGLLHRSRLVSKDREEQD